MDKFIITHNSQILPVRKGSNLPDIYDPWQRLLAAIALRAVVDIVNPEKCLTSEERLTARAFIRNHRALYQELGIPQAKLTLLEKELNYD